MTEKKILKIDSAMIESSEKQYNRDIINVAHVKLQSKISDVDSNGSNELSVEARTIEDSIINLFGTYGAIKNEFNQQNLLTGRFNLREYFTNIYSFNVAAKHASKNLEDITLKNATMQNRPKFNYLSGSHTVESNMIDSYVQNIIHLKPSVEYLAGITNDYFSWIIEGTNDASQLDVFSDFINQIKNIDLEINGQLYSPFEIPKSNNSIIVNDDISYDNIIANKEAIDKCSNLVSRIACYDPNSKSNHAINSPKVEAICLYGKPGCGKSLLIDAMINDFADRANSVGVPFNSIEISNKTIKDKYIGEGLKALSKDFESAKNSTGFGMIIFDDVDQILESRDDYDRSNHGQELTNEVMRNMDGISKNYSGNYIAVFATNRRDLIDSAITSRVGDANFYEVLGPQTKSDYLDLFKLLSKNISSYLDVNDKEYFNVGKHLYDLKLSGREIGSLISHIDGKIFEKVIPKEVNALRGQAQIEALDALRVHFSYNQLISTIDNLYDGQK